jgi:hypothetical protein
VRTSSGTALRAVSVQLRRAQWDLLLILFLTALCMELRRATCRPGLSHKSNELANSLVLYSLSASPLTMIMGQLARPNYHGNVSSL